MIEILLQNGFHPVLDRISHFLDDFSSLDNSLLFGNGSNQNKAICEGANKRFSPDDFSHSCCSLRPNLRYLQQRLWVVLKRFMYEAFNPLRCAVLKQRPDMQLVAFRYLQNLLPFV